MFSDLAFSPLQVAAALQVHERLTIALETLLRTASPEVTIEACTFGGREVQGSFVPIMEEAALKTSLALHLEVVHLALQEDRLEATVSGYHPPTQVFQTALVQAPLEVVTREVAAMTS